MNVNGAYPLAMTTYILLRENYFYFKEGTALECLRVKDTVSFWNYALTNDESQKVAMETGWIPFKRKFVNEYAQGVIIDYFKKTDS